MDLILRVTERYLGQLTIIQHHDLVTPHIIKSPMAHIGILGILEELCLVLMSSKCVPKIRSSTTMLCLSRMNIHSML